MTTNEMFDGAPVVSDPSDDRPFDGVPAPLQAALSRRGFTKLTEVQHAVLDADAPLRDLRISSWTGSGKTVALGLALAQRLIEGARPKQGPSVLVVAPTRELAEQVRGELDWLYADVPGVSTECVTGGTSVSQEQRRLSRRPRILVATPGRLLDHVRQGAVDLGGVDQLVLDEADQMLDMGFREELEGILDALPAERRTHMVSATFPDDVLELAERYQSDALHVEGSALGQANADIEHVACVVHPRDREAALVNLLLMAGDERTLVFVRTRQDTATLAEKLAEQGFSALPLSGDLAQAQRTRTLNAFRRGMVTTLVATDVAARGIDVPEVSQVVHFDPPIDAGVYTHRSGRTGRAGRKGRSVMLVPPTAQQRIRRLLDGASADASWRDAPGAEQVRKVLDERARDSLAATIDGEPAAEAQVEAAQRLLETRDAVQVVAKLLGLAIAPPTCAPREIAPAPAQRASRREPRGEARRPTRASSYARFAIDWGSRHGATPKRLLAHVCRRGGITGDRVGAIEVSQHSATFEVDSAVAGSFASRVRTPDRREPHLTIRMLETGARSNAR